MGKMTRKARQERQIKEKLNIKNRRGDTFVGCRPTVYADKTKYGKKDRRMNKVRSW